MRDAHIDSLNQWHVGPDKQGLYLLHYVLHHRAITTDTVCVLTTHEIVIVISWILDRRVDRRPAS